MAVRHPEEGAHQLDPGDLRRRGLADFGHRMRGARIADDLDLRAALVRRLAVWSALAQVWADQEPPPREPEMKTGERLEKTGGVWARQMDPPVSSAFLWPPPAQFFSAFLWPGSRPARGAPVPTSFGSQILIKPYKNEGFCQKQGPELDMTMSRRPVWERNR